MMLATAGVVLVVLYAIFEYYTLFLMQYGGVVVYLVVRFVQACYHEVVVTANRSVLQWFCVAGFSAYLVGVVFWVADNLACSILGVGHLHIGWHFLAGYGTYVFVMGLVALTMDTMG